MGCFPSRPEGQHSGALAALQNQVRALQQQLAQGGAGAAYAAPVVHGGGVAEVLFFPDPALPCNYGANCRRRNCTFAHEATSLGRLLHILAGARASIDVCVFTITCDDIANALLAAHGRGVRVRVITDNDQAATQGSDIARLRAGGVAVETDSDSFHMHHKFAVLDGRLLLNGSFNWTRQAVLSNQENVVLTDHPLLVSRFSQQFEALWRKYAATLRKPPAMALAALSRTRHTALTSSAGARRRNARLAPPRIALDADAGLPAGPAPRTTSSQQPAARLQELWHAGAPAQQQAPAAAAPDAASWARAGETELQPWAERLLRQVSALPSGRGALVHLLLAAQGVLAAAERACPSRATTAAAEAYLHLALIDIIAQGWRQRMAELQALQDRIQQDAAAARARPGSARAPDPSALAGVSRQALAARMSLAGCRYLRIEAAKGLARRVHQLLDGEGHAPGLDLDALPQPHTTGLNFGSLLESRLGLDLASPAPLRSAPAASLAGLSWDDYHAASTDPGLQADEVCHFWNNTASLVPAPHAKFSTASLAAHLGPELVLSSLPNGVWGRALVGAAIEVGLVLDAWAEQPATVMAAAGSIGSASGWLWVEAQLGLQGKLTDMRQLALSVAAAAVTMLQAQQQQQ
ncbi:cardiolipin hydrolase [Scenedesmus sp. PABB004]|nr:cardiolipin hydrolase [Scenedesmus sp. PABB004]